LIGVADSAQFEILLRFINKNYGAPMESPSTRFRLLEPVIASFVGLLLISNIIAQKFLDLHLGGLTLTTDVGTLLLFPVTYIFSDILTEVYGYAVSRRVVWYGFAMNALAALVFSLAVALPFSPDFTAQKSFAAVLGQFPGLVLASLVGYWFGSFTNDSVIAAMKVWMVRWDPQHRWLPLRTIASTIAGELVDTSLFVGVGTLVGVFPASIYLDMVLTQWLIKTLVETVLTPVTVLVVRRMKRFEQTDVVGTDTWSPFAFGKGGGTNLWASPVKSE
jgi:uncharacterized integral membrane protein (TIGR00697 family)